MSTQYTLTVKNNSSQSGSFCIFQEAPDTNQIELVTLAWLAKQAHPTTQLTFDWKVDYNFLWTNATALEAGTQVKANQTWDANLQTQNSVVLNKKNGAYTFEDLDQGEYEGTLYINQAQRVESRGVSVGIGMSGKGAFVVPSQPNMQLMMRPKPTYWIVFGDYKEGAVLDIGKVSQEAYKLEYKGVTDLAVEFTAKNNWKAI
ncbi:MAG: hypothetical protein OXE99_15070 [Cellvibrionales bacterium]|nr:hypothetical protein [Cellvibrionales bacterium]